MRVGRLDPSLEGLGRPGCRDIRGRGEPVLGYHIAKYPVKYWGVAGAPGQGRGEGRDRDREGKEQGEQGEQGGDGITLHEEV